MEFPVSGVHCAPWLPPLVAFVIASLTASGGLSGAFLILPFQMSVLGYVSPGVTPTNLLYNVVAIPGGVYRYIREGRMAWPLTWMVILGTLPGVFLGALIRVRFLPDARNVKVVIGLVLMYMGSRLLSRRSPDGQEAALHKKFQLSAGLPADAVVKTKMVSLGRIEYEFWGETFGFSPLAILALSLAVGLVGGIYGVGGGAIIAPFVVAFLGLPVYTIAGATLLGTFLTSVAGVGYFELLAPGRSARPDYALGALFGVGGLFGTYVGARIQKHLPQRWIRLFLGFLVTGLGLSYIIQFFLKKVSA